MDKAKLFMNGRSQAVRLPEKFRIEGDEVFIKKAGDAVILIPYHAQWKTLVDGLGLFSADFMEDYERLPLQDRKDIFS